MQLDYQKTDTILENHQKNSASIISIMQDIQKEYNYLPQNLLIHVAEELKLSEAKVYSIATFYENFSLVPKGKHIIRICDGTACHVRKSIPILDALRKELNLSSEKVTTEDLLFTVETVSCLGACGLAPVLTVNDKVYPAMTPEKARDMLNEIKEGEQK